MDAIYPVALSVLSHALLRDSWESISSEDPEKLFRDIISRTEPVVQPYLLNFYPADPLDAAGRIIETCRKTGIGIIHMWDPAYPYMLSKIHRPPLVLYRKGGSLPSSCIAIVGTRRADPVSLGITEMIAGALSSSGYAIVSGMAVGIDRQAHLTALQNGGATVGILAQGIDRIYPLQNRDIYSMISDSETSCLLSEYPPGSRADKWTFARRNRIISGLCSGVVVVKAGERSGAMITARHAIEQNRDVFSCPGCAYDPGYAGCLSLIRSGAIAVSRAEDILEELSPVVLMPGENKNSTKIFYEDLFSSSDIDADIISDTVDKIPLSGIEIDELIRLTAVPVHAVQQVLVELELRGLIQKHGSLVYKTVRNSLAENNSMEES